MHDAYLPGTPVVCTEKKTWTVVRYIPGRGYVLSGVTGRILVPKKKLHSHFKAI